MSNQSLKTATVKAHAKINLLLKVMGKEESGYHSIETVFARLELHDVVGINMGSSSDSIFLSGPALPKDGLGSPKDNLAWKAAEEFRGRSGWTEGFEISIEKHIPAGGGLGGGSADAAAVLQAMNSLSPLKLSYEELLDIGRGIGADVPFFVSYSNLSLAWGHGDRLIRLAPLPSRPVSLILFHEGVSTGEAYSALSNNRVEFPEIFSGTRAREYRAEDFSTWEALADLSNNDFESVVPSIHRGVRLCLPVIRAQVSMARAAGETCIGMMSGSGASCFIVHSDVWQPDFRLPEEADARILGTRTL